MPLPYWPGVRQRDARLAAHFLDEGVRHLQQHAGAVAGIDLAAAGAAVVEVLQDLDRLLEDAVRLVALDVDDEALAARVVLVARVVETLPRRRPELHGRSLVRPRRGRRAAESSRCGELMVGPCLVTGVVRARSSLSGTPVPGQPRP